MACGIVITVCLVATGYWVLLAYMITPDGPWDHKAVSDSRIVAGVGCAFAALTGLLTLVFVKATWLRVWWYALPGLLGVAALVRLFFPHEL